MFQLTEQEFDHLKSQIVISSWGGLRRAYPYAFTEQGVAMLSSVLRSKRAIQVNIAIMRAFAQLREMIASNKGLARRLNELEKKYDGQFRVVFEAIRELMAEPAPNPAASDSRPDGSPSVLVTQSFRSPYAVSHRLSARMLPPSTLVSSHSCIVVRSDNLVLVKV